MKTIYQLERYSLIFPPSSFNIVRNRGTFIRYIEFCKLIIKVAVEAIFRKYNVGEARSVAIYLLRKTKLHKLSPILLKRLVKKYMEIAFRLLKDF